MTLRRLFALLFLVAGATLSALGQNTVSLQGSGAPSGGCAFVMRYLDKSNGLEYGCPNGTWVLIGPGAAGTAAFNTLTAGTNSNAGTFTATSNTWDFSGATLFKISSGTHFNAVDPTDPTKILSLDLSNITTATTRTFSIPNANFTGIVPFTCTNQVATAVSALGASTCTTLTKAFTSGTFPADAHNLLSTTHGDTTAASAVRGDMIAAVGATPTWQRVAHSTATGGYWKWNGTDVVASTGAASGTGACTNQVVTTLNADGAPTCTTITNAYTSGTFTATAHNLLSAIHGDTTVGTVTRGATITGQGASPTWAILLKGLANQCYMMDPTGTDVIWGTCPGAGTIGGTGTANFIVKWTAPTTVANSLLSDDATTLTYTGTGGIKTSSTAAGSLAMQAGSNANTVTLSAPSGAITSNYTETLPTGVASGIWTQDAFGNISFANLTMNTSLPLTGGGSMTGTGATTLTFACPTCVRTDTINVYTAGPQDLDAQALTMQAANDTVTGTTVNLLAKLTNTGAIAAGTTDTTVPVYIVDSGAGKTGNAKLAIGGQEACKMDANASATEGFYVIASTTTAGECHAQSTPPSGVYVVGTLISNSTTSGATSVVNVTPHSTPLGTLNSYTFSGPGGIFGLTGGGPVTSGAISTALSTAGTSGGVPYFSNATTLTSSAALANHGAVIGGGAGAAPHTVTDGGSSGLCLVSGGASADPSFTTCPGGGGGGGNGGPNIGTAFTAQTSVTILGTTHGFGTKNLIVSCYDNASPANHIQPASYTVDGTSFNVVINFATAQTGYCVINGSGPPKYATTFTNQTSVTVAGTTHNLGTADLTIHVYDSATGTRTMIVPQSVAVNSTTFDVTVTFAVAQSGRIVIE